MLCLCTGCPSDESQKSPVGGNPFYARMLSEQLHKDGEIGAQVGTKEMD